jgi:hypothetical protein
MSMSGAAVAAMATIIMCMIAMQILLSYRRR